MEQLNKNEKVISITFLVDSKMNKAVDTLMDEKNWKRSAFIRVCIQKELDRLKGLKK